MISPNPLDRLVEQDTFAEAMALLEPEDLVIASLRLEGLSDEQIAALLDVDRATICRRIEQARQRIVEALPELAPVLRDRHYRSLRCQRRLQRGWLCPAVAGEPDPSSHNSPSFHGGTPLVRRNVRCPSQRTFDASPQRQRKGSRLLRARARR